MSFTTKAAVAELKHKPGRLAAVLLAIIIGSLFAVATTVFSSTAGRAVEVAVAEPMQNADLVVSTDPSASSSDDLAASVASSQEAIESTDGVVAVAPMLGSVYHLPGGSPLSGIRFQSVIDDEQLAYERLAEGAFPQTPTEIALDPATAREAKVSVGNEVTFTGVDGQQVTFTVTGITDPNEATASIAGSVSWVTADFLLQDSTAWIGTYIARVDGDPDEIADRLNASLPDGFTAMTGDAARAELVKEISGGTVTITVLLGSFAAIALVVAGVVIANTFAILLAQRRRQIALQRLVGATAKQMRRQILIEATAIGLIGTFIGAVLGIAVGYVGADVVGAAAGGLTMSPVSIAIACAATVAATVYRR